jgi:hypothetical protein
VGPDAGYPPCRLAQGGSQTFARLAREPSCTGCGGRFTGWRKSAAKERGIPGGRPDDWSNLWSVVRLLVSREARNGHCSEIEI